MLDFRKCLINGTLRKVLKRLLPAGSDADLRALLASARNMAREPQ